VGGGGHCRSVIDTIEEEGRFKIVGILDMSENVGTTVLGYPIIGTDLDFVMLSKSYVNFLITIGHIKSNEIRKRIFGQLKSIGCSLPTIISPTAKISKHARIGEGTVVLHQSVVNASATIGVNCIINTASVIEHDVKVGNHCHVGPGACINGECNIQDNCFIGSNAVLVQGIEIHDGSLIAAGTVLRSNVNQPMLMAGNPGIKKREL
jgi:sugar O-acyltransferase (sialic acid O-acetyltransferase NeuD family)